MSRIMVLGAGGMLGHKVCQGLRGHQVVGLVRKQPAHYARFGELFSHVDLVGGVDVLDGERLEAVVRDLEPCYVVNCVGLVKQLEEAADPYRAVSINALLPHRLAQTCAGIGARLIHISTDCVFDGRRAGYRESDATDAQDLYGKSKALGETLRDQESAVTLRTSFIGRELEGPFHGLMEWFLANEGSRVRGCSRVVYTGLTALELANVIRRVVDRDRPLHGLYQVASQPISKLDILLLVRDVYQLQIEIQEEDEPVSDRSLVASKFTAETGYTAPDWREMIQRMHRDPTPYDGWRSGKKAGT